MDIYSAETSVTKLLSYVKEINDTKPNMYRKSKDRLRELAVTCNEVVKVISEILQDEALEQDDIEFGYNDKDEVYNMISSMQDQLNNLKSFVNYESEPESTVQVHATFKTSKISSQMRKQTIANYSKCLYQLSSSDIKYPTVADCSKLIWRWFEDRFITTPKTHPEFRYNIRRMSNWVRDIVIVYSTHLDSGTLDEFILEFNTWCDSLYTTDAGNKFAVPYEIYALSQLDTSDSVSETAAVIWDILLDNGLRRLCTADPYDLYPSEDCVYIKCGELNSDCLENYVDYKTDPSILRRCNLEEV